VTYLLTCAHRLCVYNYATTPPPRSLSISPPSIPRTSERISLVCCPSVGGGMRMLGFDSENFTGVLTSLSVPHDG
jgi:hypothetical protein